MRVSQIGALNSRPWRSTRDPSLRLKNGSVQDDAAHCETCPFTPLRLPVLLDSNAWRCRVQAAYILSAVRTPIGKFGGTLASLTAADLGVVAAKAAMERAGVRPEQVEEAVFGCARQAGGGPNVARQISVRAGVPQEK